MGVFHSPKGDMILAIFDYPTPQMAMQQVHDSRNCRARWSSGAVPWWL